MWLYDRLFPDDEDPRSVRKWRRTVAHAILLLALFAGFLVAALTKGVWGLGSVAWSGEVDKKIEKAIEPINTKLDNIEKAVAAQARSTKFLLSKVSEDQILFLVKQRCKSNDPDELRYLTGEIKRYINEYEENSGKTYVQPTCSELGYSRVSQ